MKIRKFIDFINEELNDTPEAYIDIALKQIKKKVDRMFDEAEADVEGEEPKRKSIKQAKLDSEDRSKMTFKDLGVRLESSEISKYSKMYDNLTVKFSDDNATYNLLIMIDIKEALPKDPEADYSHEDIEKCYIKFKKYNIDTFEVVGQLTKNVVIKDIDEEFLVNLKIELDEMFGDEDEEEFKIEEN
jgi:hypothetical protein